MLVFFLHLTENRGQVPDFEGIELPDLEAAISIALDSALDIMVADVKKGRLDLEGRIDISDESGDVVHVVHFRELIDVVGSTRV